MFWGLSAFGLNYLILRYFNVAGASTDLTNGQRGKGAGKVVFNATKAAVHNKVFTIFGNDYPTPDGTCVRDYIHVEDLNDIHVLGLKHLFTNQCRATLNCGYAEGYSAAAPPQSLVGDNSELVAP